MPSARNQKSIKGIKSTKSIKSRHPIWDGFRRTYFTKKAIAIVLILSILAGILYQFREQPVLPPSQNPGTAYDPHDYRQEKVAEGAYILKDREPLKQTLASAKKPDLNLKENTQAVLESRNGGEVYRWSVKLSSGTVFSFGKQIDSGILPLVKVANNDGEYVRYYPQREKFESVKPIVKGNVISWDIAPGITARYTMQDDGVKADYIVRDSKVLRAQSKEGNTLDFVVEHSEDLKPELMPEGEIAWLGEADQEIFSFPKPVAFGNQISADSERIIADINQRKSAVNQPESFTGTYKLTNKQDTTLLLSISLPQDELEKAKFPLTIDPQVVDIAVINSTAYGNKRQLMRDGWGNLITHTVTQTYAYKNYNTSTWTLCNCGPIGGGLVAMDVDSAGDLHIAYKSSSGVIYGKQTVTRNTNNEITSITSPSTLALDTTTANRPSLFIANKGEGAGKEKVAVVWASNSTSSTIRGELRFLQCDVADTCTTASNWKNADESENGSTGSGACADGTTGLPSSAVCTGAADPLLRTTASHTTHHGVITQMPGKPRRSPTHVKWDDNGVFSDLTNANDNNSGTTSSINSLNHTQDYVYIGDNKPFSKVSFDITDTNSTGLTQTGFEYWDGDSWNAVEGGAWNTLGASGADFSEDGSILFDEPSTWATTSVDGVSKYWIRFRPAVATFDTSVSLAEIYLNDRNSKALMVVGGDAASSDLRTAYVVWDDIGQANWENNPNSATSASNAWRESATGASSGIDDIGAAWSTVVHFPLTATTDYVNNRTYIAYMCFSGLGGCTGQSGVFLEVKSIPNNKEIIVNTNWSNTGLHASINSDSSTSITSDGGDIYLFYVNDHDTNGLAYRKCSLGGGGNGNICDVAADWGSEQMLVANVSTTSEPVHPQAIVTKAFGDTVAIDVIYTSNLTTDTVNHERHYVDLADKRVTVAADSQTVTYTDCVSGSDWFNEGVLILLGHEEADSVCDGAVDSENHLGLGFANVTIPQGAAIASAYVDIRIIDDFTSGLAFTIYGEDANSGSALNSAPWIPDKTRTTASYSHTIDFVTNTYRLDVTEIIQEIVCRGAGNAQPCVGDFNGSGSWASGNTINLLLIAETSGSVIDNTVNLEGYSASGTMLPNLEINLSSTGKNYSMGAATQVASGSASLADLDHPMSQSQVSAVGTDDDLFASVSATMNYASSSAQPAIMFKVNNSNNTNTHVPTITAKVKSSVSGALRKIALQVYRGGSTDDWVEVASNNISPGDSEFTLTGSISSSLSEYYYNETPGIGSQYAECTTATANCWLAFRVIQELEPSAPNQVLSVDYLDVSFAEGDPTSSTIRGGSTFRGGTTFQ